MASKDVTYLIKQYYGRNPNADEMKYWKDKDPFALRDALVKSSSPDKAKQIQNIYAQYLGKGTKPSAQDIKYWSGKDFDQLKKNLAKDPRTEIYSTDQAIYKQKAKEAATDKQREQYYKKEFEPAWQKQFKKEEADYLDTLNTATERITKLKGDYKTAMQRGDQDLARNIKRMHDDYNTKVGQMVEDRGTYTKDLEQQTGQSLKSADVNYAERGLFRSGAREGKKEYIQEEANEQQGKYMREYDRRKQEMDLNKQRQQGDWQRNWQRQQKDMGGSYNQNLTESQRQLGGMKRDWGEYQDKFKTGKQTHKASYMQSGKQESLLGTGYQGWTAKNYNF